MKIDWNKLNNMTDEERYHMHCRTWLKTAEMIFAGVPSAASPNSEVADVLENLLSIKELSIDTAVIEDLRCREYDTPVSSDAMLLVTSKIKEANKLVESWKN